jgi:small subunit ribosomal protein S16
MALKIRLQRGGKTHKPAYRIVVADSRSRRDGRFVEVLGTYNPCDLRKDEQIKLNLERAEYWRSVGAQPSDTARTIINRFKRENPEKVQELSTPKEEAVTAEA